MSKILKRCLAYFIDMMVVMIIAQSISGISVLNPQLDKYNKYYDEYSEMLTKYYDFKADLNSSFEDEKLTDDEYQKLIEDNDDYKEFLSIYYSDNKLSKKEYNKLVKKIDKKYLSDYKKIYYQVEKYSTVYFAIYLITTIAYFIGFNIVTDGQTLGKKLFRLKVVSSKGDNEKVSVLSYIIRAIILYQPIYYLVKLIGIYMFSSSLYYNVTSVLYDIQFYLEFIIIVTVMIRVDGRGLHDLLARTRVTSYDRDGKEINEENVSFITKKLDGKKINNK